MSQFGSVSCVGSSCSHRGRSVEKGRVAIAAPLALGARPVHLPCGTFCCGVLCGIQFTISVLFVWLLPQWFASFVCPSLSGTQLETGEGNFSIGWQPFAGNTVSICSCGIFWLWMIIFSCRRFHIPVTFVALTLSFFFGIQTWTQTSWSLVMDKIYSWWIGAADKWEQPKCLFVPYAWWEQGCNFWWGGFASSQVFP